jgi:REP element-mobilizing transposase RayT
MKKNAAKKTTPDAKRKRNGADRNEAGGPDPSAAPPSAPSPPAKPAASPPAKPAKPAAPPPVATRWWTKRYRPRLLAPWRRRSAEELAGLSGSGGAAERDEFGERLASLSGAPAIYHCVSRVVDRRRVFGPAEKERFVAFMRQYEAFCQVRVLTHCVMGNHFHILVEIPEPPEDRGRSWSDEEFLRHLSILYSGPFHAAIARELRHLRKQGRDAEAGEFRGRFFARMWDLSAFMHDLKLRFAKWFNREHGRRGVLWSENFKSVLVEPGRAARVVGAYIDLNPVRAGIVGDPKDYRWSGYGEAVAGVSRAREGMRLLVFEEMSGRAGRGAGAGGACGSWRSAAAEYRKLLYLDGEESRRDGERGRAGIPARRVGEVLARGGELSEAEMLRCRTRYFTDGLALGGEGFLEGVFRLARERFGPGRRSGARRIRRVATGLRALWDLRKQPLG